VDLKHPKEGLGGDLKHSRGNRDLEILHRKRFPAFAGRQALLHKGGHPDNVNIIWIVSLCKGSCSVNSADLPSETRGI